MEKVAPADILSYTENERSDSRYKATAMEAYLQSTVSKNRSSYRRGYTSRYKVKEITLDYVIICV